MPLGERLGGHVPGPHPDLNVGDHKRDQRSKHFELGTDSEEFVSTQQLSYGNKGQVEHVPIDPRKRNLSR